MQNESDTLPFTNRFNYLVREISIEEFRSVLAQLEREENDAKRNEPMHNKTWIYH